MPALEKQPELSVSTHDLTKRSTKTSVTTGFTAVFQLTTSRRGRRKLFEYRNAPEIVSTHDLTKRSTNGARNTVSSICVSTHDLTKRSTDDIKSSSMP